MRVLFSNNKELSLMKLLLSLGSGYLGGLANVISVTLINGLSGNLILDNQFFYKQIAWGGIWGVFYTIDVFENNWKLKGLFVSIIATIFTFFVFQTLTISIETLARSFFVNVLIWGGVSSFLYHNALISISKFK